MNFNAIESEIYCALKTSQSTVMLWTLMLSCQRCIVVWFLREAVFIVGMGIVKTRRDGIWRVNCPSRSNLVALCSVYISHEISYACIQCHFGRYTLACKGLILIRLYVINFNASKLSPNKFHSFILIVQCKQTFLKQILQFHFYNSMQTNFSQTNSTVSFL